MTTSFSVASAEAAYTAGQITSPIQIADSASNVSANLDQLQQIAGAGKVAGISLTDGGSPTLTVLVYQAISDATAITAIAGSFVVDEIATPPNLTISGLANHATMVQFSGVGSDYTISMPGNGTVLVTDVGTGRSSVDSLTNITALQFADHLDFVTSQVPASPGGISSAQVADLYSAVLARPPDVAGLAFYEATALRNPSTPITTYAEWFLLSPEYATNSAHDYAQTPAGDAQFITDTYANLLHRAPEAGAVAYYQSNVIAPILSGLTPGTAAYSNAELLAHATVLAYFSQSPEFLDDVAITALHPADSQHWLLLTSPYYTIATDGQASVTEGGTENFRIAASGMPAGTVVYYSLSGVSDAQVVGSQLSGTVSIGASGVATLPVSLVSTLGLGLTGPLVVSISVPGSTSVLASASEPLTETSAASYTILPANPQVNENAGTETFTITRSTGVGTATIYLSTTDGSTVSGESVNAGDFSALVDQAVTFASGQTSAQVSIGILDHGLTSGTKTFGLTVTAGASGASLATDTFTILDNDMQTTALTVLPNLQGDTPWWPADINSAGTVVGGDTDSSDHGHGFIWSGGTTSAMLPLGGDPSSMVLSINSTGLAAGFSWTYGSSVTYQPVYWKNGVPNYMGNVAGLQDGEATGVNDYGQIVGYSYAGNGSAGYAQTTAFLWQNGTMSALSPLSGYSIAEALAINNSGQIVGLSSGGPDGNGYITNARAVLWQNGTVINLGTLPGDLESKATAINQTGQIVGMSYNSATNYLIGYGQAVLWQNYQITALGTLGGGNSWAYGINDNGQVVGASYTSAGIEHAYIWQNGKMTDLNTLLPASSKVTLEVAYSINDSGQVLCFGTSVNADGSGADVTCVLQLPATLLGHAMPTGASGAAANLFFI